MAKYEVLYPVLKGTKHLRGSVVELDDHDGANLTAQGHVKPIVVKQVVEIETAAVDLEALTKAQLSAYALKELAVQLPSSLTRQEMVEQIKAAFAVSAAGA